MNHPQFWFPTPEGYVDVPAVVPISYGQDGVISLPAGQFLKDYVVQLDDDAPTLIRSLFWQGLQQGQGADETSGSIQIQIRDAYGTYLTDGYVPIWLYVWGAGQTPPDGGSGKAKVFEPELYCPPRSILLIDFFNPGGINSAGLPILNGPYLQSPSHTAVQMENYPVSGAGQGAGIISANGALYQLLQRTGSSGATAMVGMWKSTNGGQTWTQLDAVSGPGRSTTPVGGAFYDGANTLTVASSLGSRITPLSSPIFLQDFDLTTETWGAVYGTVGAPSVFGVNQAYKRSDGSLLVIAADTIAPQSLRAYVFQGGVWTTSFSLVSLLPGGWVTNSSSSTVYDAATGTIHMFGIAFVGGVIKKQFYQQILLTNSIAGFQDLTGLYAAASAMGDPVLIGDQIIWGAMDPLQTFATIIVGSPLSAPVFGLMPSPGVLATQPIPGFPNTLQPTLATDGSRLWAVFSGDGTGADVIYLAYTDNMADPTQGWVGGIVYDDPSGTIFFGASQYPTMAIIGGLPYITYQQSAGQPTNFFFFPVAAPSEDFSAAGLLEFRGVKRYPKGCQ